MGHRSEDQVQTHRSASLPSTAPLVLAETSLLSLVPSEATCLPCHHPQLSMKGCVGCSRKALLAVEGDPMLYAHSSTFNSDIVRQNVMLAHDSTYSTNEYRMKSPSPRLITHTGRTYAHGGLNMSPSVLFLLRHA